MSREEGNRPFRADNHYVPEFYLGRWADSQERVWTYRTLVSHRTHPIWRRHRLRGLGHHKHLYSHHALGKLSDSVEEWLGKVVDSPAAIVLSRIDRQLRLTSQDWDVLLRFFAASQARTPSFFIRRQAWWDKEIPQLIQQTLGKTVADLEAGRTSEPRAEAQLGEGVVEPPINVRITRNAEDGGGKLEAKVLTGRRLWQAEITRYVARTYRMLHRLKWSIVRAPSGLAWPTSDNPAVVVRLDDKGQGFFGEGWVVPGTSLFLPLGPTWLLVGRADWRAHARYEDASLELADFARWSIVLNARRLLLANCVDPRIPELRPRRVDALVFEREREQWRKWHEEHSAAERDIDSDETWSASEIA